MLLRGNSQLRNSNHKQRRGTEVTPGVATVSLQGCRKLMPGPLYIPTVDVSPVVWLVHSKVQHVHLPLSAQQHRCYQQTNCQEPSSQVEDRQLKLHCGARIVQAGEGLLLQSADPGKAGKRHYAQQRHAVTMAGMIKKE